MDNLYLNIIDSLQEPVLPEYLLKKRNKVKVYTLDVKASPLRNKFYDFETFTKDENYELLMCDMIIPNKISSIKYEDTLTYIINKREPHSQFDLLLVEGGKIPNHSIVKMQNSERKVFFRSSYEFVTFCKRENLYPVVSITYDETKDRWPTETLKRAHLQLVARTKSEIFEIANKSTELGKYTNSFIEQRQIIDEGSVIWGLLLFDKMKKTEIKNINIVAPFKFRNCPTAVFKFSRGWEELLENDFYTLKLPSILKEVEDVFKIIYDNFFVGSWGIWKRPRLKLDLLKKTKNIDWISKETLEVLIYYFERYPSKIIELFDCKKSGGIDLNLYKNIASHYYPLCFNYGITISEDESSVYMTVTTKTFSDSGGTGLNFINGVQVKIRRSVGESPNFFTKKELIEREIFQRKCSEQIINKINNLTY